jgi:hypothetical protein
MSLENGTNYSAYKTYSFINWQNNSDELLNHFEKKRLRDAFESHLKNKNLKLVQSGGDLKISLFLSIDKSKMETEYEKYYKSQQNQLNRFENTINSNEKESFILGTYAKGTLIVDVFETSSGQQVWQAVADRAYHQSPKKKEKSINKTVRELVKKYPV